MRDSQQTSGPVAAARAIGAVRLGDYLVERGSIAPDQLAAAVCHEAASGGGLVGRVPLDHGWITDDAPARARLDLADVPFAELDPDNIEPAAVEAVPPGLPPRLGMMPVATRGDRPVVACPDPFDVLAIDETEISSAEHATSRADAVRTDGQR